MKKIKTLLVVTISTLILSSNTFHCIAQDLVWHELDKEEIFEMALEQDRFVLLFVGNYENVCPYCTSAFREFNNPSGTLRKFIDENYVTWFRYFYLPGSTLPNPEGIEKYIATYLEARPDPAIPQNFPIICIVNPGDPEEDYTEYWGAGHRTHDELVKAITPPDLFAGQELTWYDNKNKAVQLAKQQNKYIFKLIGKPTSPNSKTVLKQLTAEPLKEMLEDNYILLYSSDVSEITYTTYSSQPILPYIAIIDPEEPDVVLEELIGYQDVETLEELIKSYPVANEIVASVNNVTVTGNILQISNRNNNEQIQIFTLTGQQIANIRKNDYSVKIDISRFPKGALIVYSSSGWSSKVVIR